MAENKGILVFAGTTEGRELAEYLRRQQIDAHVLTATEYGEQLLIAPGNGADVPGSKGDGGPAERNACRGRADSDFMVSAGRLDAAQMCALIEEEKPEIVVDATHPYAVLVSENISKACAKTGTEYVRLLRKSLALEAAGSETDKACLREDGAGDMAEGDAAAGEELDGCTWVESAEEAVRYLEGTTGNVFVTTGSKELSKYTALTGYESRVYARILSVQASMDEAVRLGFSGSHLICMQGPFSEEINAAMLRQTDARYMVTKESGANGGFLEKIQAARRTGVHPVVIGRPGRESGKSLEEVKAMLCARLHISVKRIIDMVGIGMGSPENMTVEARRACEEAQLLIGAERMLEAAQKAGFNKPSFKSYKAEEIYEFVTSHPEYDHVAVLLSGDVGFYSGAKKLYELFDGDEINVYCGISSAVYLCGKLHTSWEDARLVSLHGRSSNIISAVARNPKVFALVGERGRAAQICRDLCEYHMGDVTVTVGEELSYENERIVTGTAAEMSAAGFAPLCVMLIQNQNADSTRTHGIPDEEFIRARVPMTKEEIRSVSLSKLKLASDSVIYDVGAGTGSVSVEMALQAEEGHVYAIEKKEEAANLIEENKHKFKVQHITVVRGLAPDVMEELPAPTHAFIGGSSGNLKEILACIFKKNLKARIVINAIVLETVAEALSCIKEMKAADVDIVSVSSARSKEAGPYHMMMGQNPVYVISFTGGGADE